MVTTEKRSSENWAKIPALWEEGRPQLLAWFCSCCRFQCCLQTTSSLCQPRSSRHASPSSQQLWSAGFFCGWPCDMKLVIRQSEKSGHQQRLLQAFTEDVFICSLLVYIAHYSFLDDALYKFTYLLTLMEAKNKKLSYCIWRSLRRSRSFKVTDFGTGKPVCDFPLVVNTKWHPISHRFLVIVQLSGRCALQIYLLTYK